MTEENFCSNHVVFDTRAHPAFYPGDHPDTGLDTLPMMILVAWYFTTMKVLTALLMKCISTTSTQTR